MTDQKLLYTLEGDASGLKKAMAEAMAANRQMTDALTRKIGEVGAFKSAQEELTKLSAALVEAKRKRDFFINSAASGGAAGTKLFAADIAKAKNEVLRLADAEQKQRARLAASSQALTAAGIDTRNLAAAEARLASEMRGANAATSAQVAAFQKTHVQSSQVKRSFEDVQTAAGKLRAAFAPLIATLAAGFGVRGLARAADEYANLQARLKLAARSQEEFNASNEAIQRIASAAQAPLSETAQLYIRIANSLKDANVSQSKFVDTTEAMALALRLSGASVAESQSAMLQFSQAIASGVLRGEEFNSVSEAAPRLLQALAVSLNKPVAELRAMAKEGQLTRDVLINGLAAELPTLRREAESLPKTLAGAFTEMGNRILLMVGQIDQASGASASLAKSFLELGTPAIRVVFQTLTVLAANLAFVFKTVGQEIGAYAAQVAAMLRLDFKGARFIRDAVTADAKAARAELDALEQKIMGLGAAKPKVAPSSGAISNPALDTGKPALSAAKPDKAALSAVRQEVAALLKAQEALEKARAEAAAQGLNDSLATRREKLEQARKAELVDEAGFIAAKAALDEEALRNELEALQGQQAKLRAASIAQGAKGSERTQALADLALVDARIESAGQKIRNLNVAATAELAALASAKLKAQAEFIDGLEQEAFLSGLTNDERETALLLLEAEKRGITDINQLLELQVKIRANASAQAAKDEAQRQQDSVYESVQQGVQRAFADGLNAVGTDGGVLGALKNAVDTLRNALSNAIAGSMTESFLGMLGGKEGVLGIAGSMGFGGKRDGSTQASAIYVQDVNTAAGALAGGDGESGLQGIFGNIMAGLRAALTSMVSGLGNLLGGLFGDAGGGQNWLGAIASMFGFAEGGWTGPGGKYQPAGVVHADEFVFDKVSTNRIGVGVLENMRRIASGRFVSSRPRSSYADGGAVSLPGAAAPTVNVNLRNINHSNMADAVSDFLNTRSGERAILNVIQRNPRAVGG